MKEKMFERVKFIGEPELTRGDYGENISFGRMDSDGSVYVWDSTYGWFFHSRFDSGLWEKTGELRPAVEAEF